MQIFAALQPAYLIREGYSPHEARKQARRNAGKTVSVYEKDWKV
jgi:hypothetical protein